MALNDRHRESGPQTGEQRAGTDQWVEPARSALEPVAASGPAPTTEAVVEALAALGLGEAQVAGGGDSVVFGLSAGTGCVRGTVGPGRLEVRGDGYILDGGCLPPN